MRTTSLAVDVRMQEAFGAAKVFQVVVALKQCQAAVLCILSSGAT